MGEEELTLEELENRIEKLSDRVEAIEKPRRSATVDVEVGDQVTVVVEDPNTDSERDAVTHIDGMATFIKTANGMGVEFGDVLTVTISDIQDRQMVAVAQKVHES